MKRIVIWCSIACLLFIMIRWNFLTYCSQKHYRFVFDDVVSQQYAHELRAEFLGCKKRCNGDKQAIDQCKKMCPFIKAISVAYTPCEILVTIKSCDPLCSVNQNLIFTDNSALLERRFFAKHHIESLPSITSAFDSIESAVCLLPRLLMHFSYDMQQNYSLHFISHHEIKFIDKHYPRYCVMCSADQMPCDDLMHQCNMVKNSIVRGGLYKESVSWTADTRFADYIVAYKA